MNEPVALRVEALAVNLEAGPPIVSDVTFSVTAGEVLGLVGESGSGKTTVALSTLGYARPGVRIAGGRVEVLGEEMLGAGERDRVARRGARIAYVPQDPSTALNPSLRVDGLIAEMLRAHRYFGDWRARTGEVLEKVGLPADRRFRRRFPHQLSGGQQQRLAIAMALSCAPGVLVLDEPTTGLDVVTQGLVLAEVKRLVRQTGVGILYVSHDLAVVADIAHRIAVMYAGRIVEQGPAGVLLGRPRHPYTLGLIESIPDHQEPRAPHGIPGGAAGVHDRSSGCAFAPRCTFVSAACRTSVPQLQEINGDHRVRCIHWDQTPSMSLGELRTPTRDGGRNTLLDVRDLTAQHHTRAGTVVAAAGISFTVGEQECVALVGESGSGKTTIARCVAGLHPHAGGTLLFHDAPLASLARQRSRDTRRRIQIVFQNPYDSLNPKKTVAQSLARPLAMFRAVEGSQIGTRVAELLEQVQLPSALGARYPPELSGGERQRVAIARALGASPDLLVCDEVTSALDVSVQAVVLELLADLRRQLGLALLFISHDLGVVATIADRVLVLERGRVREQGPVASILTAPTHPYTQSLIDAAPTLPRSGETVVPARTPERAL